LGGIWYDQSGSNYGGAQYASAVIAKKGVEYSFDLDVTDMWREWQVKARPRIGYFLRPANGYVKINGAESGKPSVTTVTFSDGSTHVVVHKDDAPIATSTAQPLGANVTMNLPVVIGVSDLDIDACDGKEITKVILRLSTPTQYSGTNIQARVFGIAMPVPIVKEEPITGPQTECVDLIGLENRPEVEWVERHVDSNYLARGWKIWNSHKGQSRISRVGDPEHGIPPLFDWPVLIAWHNPLDNPSLDCRRPVTPLWKTGDDGRGLDEVYFSYWLCLGSDFNPRDGGKLAGFDGTHSWGDTWGGRGNGGAYGAGVDGFSVRGHFGNGSHVDSNDAAKLTNMIGAYSYNIDAIQYGHMYIFNRNLGGLLTNCNWVEIGQYIKLNSIDESISESKPEGVEYWDWERGRRDGIYKAWVNNRLVYARSDVRWRHLSRLTVEHIWINTWHGGKEPAGQEMHYGIGPITCTRGGIPLGVPRFSDRLLAML
jgi:hypothetical protein